MNRQSQFKKQLLSEALWWEVAAPNRAATGYYGWKAPAPWSLLIKSINATSDESELAKVLRGRSPTIDEQDAAVRQLSRLRAQRMHTNRSIVFTQEWNNGVRVEDATAAKLCILEFTWRMLKNSYKISKLALDPKNVEFICVPEIWSKKGDKVGLHFHMMLLVPDRGLDWFDKNAARIWHQVTSQYQQWGRVHVEPIIDRNRLSHYALKQGHFDWVVQHTLLPVDLAKYRGVELV